MKIVYQGLNECTVPLMLEVMLPEAKRRERESHRCPTARGSEPVERCLICLRYNPNEFVPCAMSLQMRLCHVPPNEVVPCPYKWGCDMSLQMSLCHVAPKRRQPATELHSSTKNIIIPFLMHRTHLNIFLEYLFTTSKKTHLSFITISVSLTFIVRV